MLVAAGSATSKLQRETNRNKLRLETEEAEFLCRTSCSSCWRPWGDSRLVTAPLLLCWRQTEAADHRTQGWGTDHSTGEKG